MTVFNIVFRGKILEGFQPQDVKEKMAQLFKVDATRVEAMFSGKPVILRKNCDEETARKLKTVLGKAGAAIEVHPAQPQAAAAPKPAEPVPKKPNPFLNEDGSPATPPPPPATPKKNPFLADDGSPISAASRAPASQGDGPNILPAGSDLLSAAEREAASPPPVNVSIDHLSASEPGGVLEERLPVAELELDLSAYVLDEVGADVLAEDEKWHFEELVLDLSAYDLAAPGTDVLREDERPPQPVADVRDADWDISPAGSDLGEIEKDAPPPPPSTDHLSLG